MAKAPTPMLKLKEDVSIPMTKPTNMINAAAMRINFKHPLFSEVSDASSLLLNSILKVSNR